MNSQLEHRNVMNTQQLLWLML